MRKLLLKLIQRIADEEIGNAYAQGYALGYRHGRNSATTQKGN